MKEDGKRSLLFRNTLGTIVSVLALFLIGINAITLNLQHKQIHEQDESSAIREIDLFGKLISEAMNKGDYSTVEIFLADWASERKDLIEVNIEASNGFLIASYQRDKLSTEYIKVLRQQYAYGDNRLVTLQMTRDTERMHQKFSQLTWLLVITSFGVACILGYILWRSVIKVALLPLSKEIDKSESQLQLLSSSVEQASEAIVITDNKGDIRYVNPAYIRLTGYSKDELLGKNPRILNSGRQSKSFYEEMWRVLASGDSWRGRVVDKKKDGDLFPAMLIVSPVKNSLGEITHYVGHQQDLSEQESLESQFYQAQKMEAMGTLVGGIAHDFNNMLAGITGNLYLAKKEASDNFNVVQRLTSVEELSFRASTMIHQLLTFARKGPVTMKELPLSPFIKETLKFLRTAVPENINFCHNICNAPLLIKGDGTQIHQVLMNLVNNARDAVESTPNPSINVTLEAFQTNASFIREHQYFNVGAYAHLYVEDNGYGIPDDQIKQLFEPFYTTKDEGKGTGLGLAMVFGAIKTHQGFVEVDSEEGAGSTFHVYIPLLEDVRGQNEAKSGDDIVYGNGETILLVDDEFDILEIGKDVLESIGYQVLLASGGIEAIEICRNNHDVISLIIMDVIMPELNGVELAERIRMMRPEMKVIFVTGYDKQTLLPDDAVVIAKPYEIVEFSRTIRGQLIS